MKKIKYGNRDKTKEKKNPYLQQLKDGDDDVCGALLDSFSNDYLSYITGLVKASKTPSKIRTQERIQGLFQNKDYRDKKFQLRKQPINVVSKQKSKQVSPKSPKSYTDFKNSTLPLKNIKQINQQSQGMSQNRKQRDKSQGSVFEKKDNFNPLMGDRNFAIKQHYNRFPTQQAQKPFKSQKFDQTSIAISQNSERNRDKNVEPAKQFLQGLDQYLVTLQSHRNFKKQQLKRNTTKIRDDQQIKTIEQLYQQNVKLRRKLKKYEDKMVEIEQNMENHFMYNYNNLGSHCKRQQKSQKVKISDLTKALLRAITKVNEQRQQIESMKYEFKSFGRKAQHYAQKYEQSSDVEQQIHESLIKAMRPSRACSEYKLKKKIDIPYLNFVRNKEE